MDRRTFCAATAQALGLALGLPGCGLGGPKTPNVALIILDTVRADHVGLWGYGRNTTPRLDAFAREATAYRRAIATAPWTLPAHATLFTGQYSFQHKVEGILQKDAQGNDDVIDPPLPDAALTLAETLGAAGYATGAFTANTAYMSAPFNRAQGFGTYEVKRQPGVDMAAPISKWVRAQRKPFFLFVNIMDAHFRYNTTPCPGAFDEPAPQDPTLVNKLLDAVLPGERPADPQLVRDVTLQYDTGIANADRAAGQILDALKRHDAYNDTLIIIAADHGEYLGEHLLAQHSKDLYEEVLRVPLFVKGPRQRAGEREDRHVSLIQVYGTILNAARAQRDAPAPDLDGDAPLLAEINYSRRWDIASPIWGKRFRRLRTAYYEYPLKLIHSSDDRHELYDVESDPREARNLFAEKPEQGAAMIKRLAAIKPLNAASGAPVRAPGLSEENREALRSSGYL